MITPNIGMPVLYFAGDDDHHLGMSLINRLRPCHAVVSYVHFADCINVQVTDHSGRPNARSCVRLLQGDTMPPADGRAYATFTESALHRDKDIARDFAPAMTD